METYLYLSGLAAATSTNELGRFVLDHANVWSRVTGLNELLIRDYVTHHRNTRYISPDLTHLMSRAAVQEILEIQGGQDWTIFLETVKSWKDRVRVVTPELDLRAQASEIRREVMALRKHDVTLQFVKLLDPKDNVDIGPHWRMEIERGKTAKADELGQLLDVVDASTLAKPSTLDTSLQSVLGFVKGLKPKNDNAPGIVVSLLGKTYAFDVSNWNRLVQRSSIISVMNGYQTQAWRGSPWRQVLFGRSSKFEPIQLNRIPGEDQLFEGMAKVAGFFTKEAFDAEIAPLLAKLDDDIAQLKLPETEKDAFIAFVDETLSSYASEYIQAYTEYYEAHRLREFTRQLLPFVAREVGSVNSPYSAF